MLEYLLMITIVSIVGLACVSIYLVYAIIRISTLYKDFLILHKAKDLTDYKIAINPPKERPEPEIDDEVPLY